MSIINMDNVNKYYGQGDTRVHALKNVCVNVEQGEFVAILGPSGSGKTTLMNILGLIDTLDTGRYLLGGENIMDKTEDEYAKIRNRRVGFVFQRFNLIPKYTAAQNVAQPLLLRGMKHKTAMSYSCQLLSSLGMGDRLNNRPNQLSGGQQQRVAIARALISSPDIILADEPTGALDTQTGREVMNILNQLNKKGKTIILITHDLGVASNAQRVVRIEDGTLISDEAVKGA